LAKIADDYRSPGYMSGKGRHVVGHHFGVASSGGRKGRLLAAAVRFFEARRILEVGTAYGISSMFMGIALQETGLEIQLPAIHTLEAYEPQATLSRTLLEQELKGLVHCAKGRANEALASLAQTAAPIELVFHDAGHTYDDYIHDFAAFEPHMGPGSILILDDIRWEDTRSSNSKPSKAYEGWQAVTSHKRVKCAAEIDGSIGIALMV
jgi:predicted O-methyltransferase YrrM